jgi:hypothetical protein
MLAKVLENAICRQQLVVADIAVSNTALRGAALEEKSCVNATSIYWVEGFNPVTAISWYPDVSNVILKPDDCTIAVDNNAEASAADEDTGNAAT